MAFRNKPVVLTTSDQDLVVMATATEGSIHALDISNTTGSAATVTLKFFKNSTGTTITIASGVSIAANSIWRFPGPINLETGDKLIAAASANSTLVAIPSTFVDVSTPIATGITARDTYSSIATYAANDIVEYLGSTYITPSSVSNISPPSSPWILFAAKGATGSTGATGPANTLTIGTVTTGSVAATITGTAPNQTLNLVIPQGATGATGSKGDTGSTGPAGPANTLTIGTVTQGSAAATITGTSPNQTLNLVLPKGDTGDAGPAFTGGALTTAMDFAAAQTVASATTADIGAATSNLVIMSGSTAVTGLGTAAAGVFRYVRFSGAVPLTHNATSLILPGGANITAAVGDTALFVSEGSGNWRCYEYVTASGRPIVGKFDGSWGSITSIASASTVDLSTVSTYRALITGTTGPITSFGTGTNQVKLVRFAGAVGITHNATSLIIPGGVDITTAADDVALCTSDGSGNWRIAIYQRASGASLVAPALSAITAGTPSIAINWATAATIASASTVNIGAAATNSIIISGTTTITAFDNVAAGVVRWVRFSGALTLTHNATSLILPGAANITTAAGDTAMMVSEGSGNWRCYAYQKAASAPGGGGGSIDGLTAASGATLPTIAINWATAQTIASASTVDIGAATTNSVVVSGTTTITSFGTAAAGVVRYVRFSGALTIGHNATSLILPNGGTSITTQAGDTAMMVSEGSGNWRCYWFSRANGGMNGLIVNSTVQGYDGATAKTNQPQAWAAAQRVTQYALTSSSTITMVLGNGNDWTLTLGTNATLANPSDIASYVGQKGSIAGQQDATGSRTLAYGSYWFPVGAATAPAIPTAANAKWRIDYHVVSSTRIDFVVSSVGV